MKKKLHGLIFVAALFFIPATAWILDIHPRMNNHKQLKTEIAQQRQKLQNVKALRKKIENINKEIKNIEHVISHFRERLPSETEIDTVLKEVWTIAKQNDLQTKKISTIRILSNKRFTSPQSPYGEQVVVINITGDFRGFYSFLTTMERLPRLMKVRQMIVSEDETLPTGHIGAIVELSIFYEPSAEDKNQCSKTTSI